MEYRAPDPGQRLCGCARGMHDMDLVKLAPGVSPTRRFVDLIAVKMMKSRIGIRLERALEGLQVLPIDNMTTGHWRLF